jgi:hypothetical protein
MDHDVQHKRSAAPPAGFGYGDQGEHVPIVWADGSEAAEIPEEDAARIRQETLMRFFARMMQAGTAEGIGRRMLVIGYLLKCHGAPQNLAELGSRMGVTKGRASQILSELNAQNTGESACITSVMTYADRQD